MKATSHVESVFRLAVSWPIYMRYPDTTGTSSSGHSTSCHSCCNANSGGASRSGAANHAHSYTACSSTCRTCGACNSSASGGSSTSSSRSKSSSSNASATSSVAFGKDPKVQPLNHCILCLSSCLRLLHPFVSILFLGARCPSPN